MGALKWTLLLGLIPAVKYRVSLRRALRVAGHPNRVQAYGAVGQSLHNDFSGLSGVPRLTNVATSSILKY
jgi:hypothetical protein